MFVIINYYPYICKLIKNNRMTEDLYEILGVDKNTTPNDIKKAYRSLAKKYHPDKNPNDKEAEEHFKKVSYAYEILSDSEKKSRYDSMGHNAFNGNGGPQGFSSAEDLRDFMERTFGGRRQAPTPKQENSIRSMLNVSIDDVYEGVKKELTYNIRKICDECSGKGGHNPKHCETCQGSGMIHRVQETQMGFIQQSSPCGACGQRGVIFEKQCKPCNSNGFIVERKKTTIDVSKWVRNGDSVLINDGGHNYSKGLYGDLEIRFQIVNSAKFSVVDNYSLLSTIKVPYEVLITGGNYEFQTIDGSILKVTIPKMTQIGGTLRLKGKGIKQVGSDTLRTDQHLLVDLLFPTSVSGEEEKLLEEIKKLKE